MKCPVTGKMCPKPRVYHVTEIEDGTASKQLDLCPDCFAAYVKKEPVEKEPEPQLPDLPNLKNLTPQVADEFVQDMMTFVEKIVQKHQPLVVPQDLKTCKCGSTTLDIAKTGKMGCPECYKTFEEEMQPVIFNAHSGPNSSEQIEHVGKKPKNWTPPAPPPESPKMKMVKLNYKMKMAIQEEDYEYAARLRDEIKKITDGLKSED